MAADMPTIVASSIGFDSRNRGPYDWSPGPVYRYAAELAGAGPGARPRICFVTTAVGDDVTVIGAIYGAFAGTGFDTSHLALFTMPTVEDVRAHLLSQDVVWVGGGSTANLLAVWRVHGLPDILRECWEAGVVLGGVSAGSLCWHTGGTTDSFGPALRPITDCLGFLPWSNCPHYDTEAQRRPLYQRLVCDGVLGPGYATDNGVAVVYRGTDVADVVADRPEAAAWFVESGDNGAAETRLEPRLLR